MDTIYITGHKNPDTDSIVSAMAYAALHSEIIGQRPNLTSFSFRAFRFAKRCPGSRGGGPPFGMILASIPAHPSRPRARTFRCAPAGLGG